MAVKRVDVFHRAILPERMPHNHHVAPAHVTIACEHHDPLPDAVDRISEVSIASADSIPILTEMTMRTKSTRLVIALCVRFTDGEIETVGQLGERSIERR